MSSVHIPPHKAENRDSEGPSHDFSGPRTVETPSDAPDDAPAASSRPKRTHTMSAKDTAICHHGHLYSIKHKSAHAPISHLAFCVAVIHLLAPAAFSPGSHSHCRRRRTEAAAPRSPSAPAHAHGGNSGRQRHALWHKKGTRSRATGTHDRAGHCTHPIGFGVRIGRVHSFVAPELEAILPRMLGRLIAQLRTCRRNSRSVAIVARRPLPTCHWVCGP